MVPSGLELYWRDTMMGKQKEGLITSVCDTAVTLYRNGCWRDL